MQLTVGFQNLTRCGFSGPAVLPILKVTCLVEVVAASVEREQVESIAGAVGCYMKQMLPIAKLTGY